VGAWRGAGEALEDEGGVREPRNCGFRGRGDRIDLIDLIDCGASWGGLGGVGLGWVGLGGRNVACVRGRGEKRGMTRTTSAWLPEAQVGDEVRMLANRLVR
jgi:hypothetical protein